MLKGKEKMDWCILYYEVKMSYKNPVGLRDCE